MLLEVILLFSLIFLFQILNNRKPKDLPPGEWGLPVVGYIPLIGKRPSDALKSLSIKYGKTFCVKIGSRLHAVLSDYATIKSCLAKLEFSYRPDLFTLRVFYDFKNAGIVSSNGQVWLNNRKFALRVLSHFGMGKSKLEETIQVEVASLIEDLKTKVDKPTTIEWNLNVAILNVIWSLVADKRFDQNDAEIQRFSKMIEENFASIGGSAAILDIFPWLIPYTPRFILNFLKVNNIQRNRDELFMFFEKTIFELQESLDKNKIRCYINMYLVEMDAKNSQFSPSMTENLFEMKSSLIDLFAAGTETSATSIRWYILYMAKYPEVQRKIQQELDSNVPRDRYPSLEDKDNLPYFEASVFESMRFASLAPVAVPHAVVEDCQIDGYKIPKGTVVHAFAEACHWSADYWKRPNEFYPEHFINESGKFHIPEEGFLPFSLGRRKCLGESLAKMELFLFLGAILQNFSIMEPEGKELNLMPDPAVNFTNVPAHFEVLLKIK